MVYTYVSYVSVCTFPIFHFSYPYSNTIGKTGEWERRSRKIKVESLLWLEREITQRQQQVAQLNFPSYSLQELPSTIEGTIFGARAFIAGEADAERQSRLPSGLRLGPSGAEVGDERRTQKHM